MRPFLRRDLGRLPICTSRISERALNVMRPLLKHDPDPTRVVGVEGIASHAVLTTGVGDHDEGA